MRSTKEIVIDLIDLIENEGELTSNGKGLAILDAERADEYTGALEDQIEDTMYILDNADDLLDMVLPKEVEKLEDRIIGEVEITDPIDKIRITELLEEFTEDLTKKIQRQMTLDVAALRPVYLGK